MSTSSVTETQVLTGVPVVAGVAYAPVIRPGARPTAPVSAADVPESDRPDEVERLKAAAAAVAERLRDRAAHATGVASEVLATTAALAQDRAWLLDAEKRITAGSPAHHAVGAAIAKISDALSKAGDLMAERVTDLRDVRDRVLAQLSGLPEPGVPVPDVPSVLCAEDLAPADTAGLDPALVVALATTLGGPTSHTAIIARQLGIPCVVAVGGLDAVPAATESRPSTATTHGMPSWRAMIAVWLVGPPSDVASATTSVASRPAVSTGARSSAHRIDGRSGTGTPGSGKPLSSATTRSRMSRRSVTRSAMRSPALASADAILSMAALTASVAGRPSLMRLSASPSQARSCASVAVVASTSEATPVACAARIRSRSATAPVAARRRATSLGRSDSATSTAGASSGRGRAPGRITGAYCTPPTAGTPGSTCPGVRGDAGA